MWPASTTAWLAVLALGLGPAGAAFYLWDHAVKRGDIRALGALSYATPILSTALLIVCGLAEPTGTLLIAAALVTVGAGLASREVSGRQPGGASSNLANSKAGDTVQPTSVQAPSERAACQTWRGTTACGCSPTPKSCRAADAHGSCRRRSCDSSSGAPA